MDPHRDFNFALELQLKDLGFLEEYQDPGDIRFESGGSSSDRAYAIRCMKEDLLDLQRSTVDRNPLPEPPAQDRSRLSLSPTPEPLPLDKKCVSCLEQYETLIFTAPCNHGFCYNCTHTLILGATNDESKFPPRCCDNDVPRTVIRSVLNAEELKEYNAKALEYSTKTRLYCAEPTCAAFIPPSTIKDEHGNCLKCGRTTHVICRSFAHPGIDCPQDTELHALLKVAEQKKWKRCSACRRMVELMVGCNHITCMLVTLHLTRILSMSTLTFLAVAIISAMFVASLGGPVDVLFGMNTDLSSGPIKKLTTKILPQQIILCNESSRPAAIFEWNSGKSSVMRFLIGL